MKINKVGYDFHKLQCNTNSDDKERSDEVNFFMIELKPKSLFLKNLCEQHPSLPQTLSCTERGQICDLTNVHRCAGLVYGCSFYS